MNEGEVSKGSEGGSDPPLTTTDTAALSLTPMLLFREQEYIPVLFPTRDWKESVAVDPITVELIIPLPAMSTAVPLTSHVTLGVGLEMNEQVSSRLIPVFLIISVVSSMTFSGGSEEHGQLPLAVNQHTREAYTEY